MADDNNKNEGSLLRRLVAELLSFGEYVQEVLEDPAQREALGATLGMTPGAPVPPTSATPGDSKIAQYLDGEDIDVLALLEALTTQSGSIRQRLQDTFDEASLLALDLLATDYVYRRHPKLYFTMQFLGWMGETSSQFGEGYTTVDRALSAVLSLVGFLVLGNGDLGRLDSEGDAQALSNPTLRLAALVLVAMRIASGKTFKDWAKQDVLDMLYGWDTVPPLQGETPDPADLISKRMLSVRWHLRDKDDDPSSTSDIAIGASMALVPKAHGGPGVFLALSGGEDLEFEPAKRLRARVQLQATALPLWISTEDGLRIDVPAGMRGAVSLISQDTPDRKSLFALPDTETLRFEVGGIRAEGAIGDEGTRADVALRNCVLTFDSSRIDGFIGSLLPDRKTKVKFDLGKRYVKGSGWQWTGEFKDFDSKKVKKPGAPAPSPAPKETEALPLLPGGEASPTGGLHKRIHLGKSLGPLRLDELLIGLDGKLDEKRLDVSAAISLSAHIGPIFARVDHVGLRARLTKPDDPAPKNLSLVNLDLGFLAPRAVGITVDAKAVKGGGYVYYDPDKQQYAGVLELEITKLVAVKAIGLIATRLPDGSKGYSMVIVITAENFRWPLPMGFAITGLGGLMAIHRTCSEEALREGLRAKTLDLILFPKDPVRNAPNIIAALERVFPAQRGSYILGPMLRITWGTPVLVTMDLAVLIEWGVRDRLFVLGRVAVVLPDPNKAILVLRMDALGVFDFDQGTAAIDAVLVDSKLLDRFVLTGAMALRLRWNSPRSFAFAVGGMHRAFTPPAGFPKLERLAINFTTGSNPRLVSESYFALTSNSVQFGAAAHLYAEGPMNFNVTGDASYDVLITLAPFHFLAEFMASMQIRKGSRNLFKVKVEGALEGPRPLALRAKATFEILWWDVSIRVNVTLVGGGRPPLPPAVDVRAQLLAALRDARNWHTELPVGQSRIIVLREPTGGGDADAPILVHPLSVLSVRQGVVPLNTAAPIDRYGGAPVSGARQFRIAGIAVDGVAENAAQLQAVREDFAPAQFFDMTDDQKLTSPSFVPMDAGVQIASAAPTFDLGKSVTSPLDFETKVIDRSQAPASPTRVVTLPVRYALPLAQLEQQARFGAAGRSVLRRLDPLLDEVAPKGRVQMAALAFRVIDAEPAIGAFDAGHDATVLRAAAARSSPLDFVGARAAVGRGRKRQVVPAFEKAL